MFSRFVLVLSAAALLLAGCGSAPEPMSSSVSGQNSRLRAQSMLSSLLRRLETVPRASHETSWIDAATGPHTLVYFTNGGGRDVLIDTYPGGKRQGSLASQGNPTGICSDADGNVWVVNALAAKITKYAHDKKKPSGTLHDPDSLNEMGCSVDPVTGNLAVTSLGNGSLAGNIAIYTDAKGSAKKYSPSALAEPFFVAYDNAGNLFVDGLNKDYEFVLLELPSGSKTFETVTLSGTVGFPGGLAWDGEYLAIGDQEYESKHDSAIYQYSIAGSAGTLEGTTVLNDSCDVLQFAIAGTGSAHKQTQGTSLVAPDDCSNREAFYAYPAGGNPTQVTTGLSYPVAAAISVPAGTK